MTSGFYTVSRSSALGGSIGLPGDKSISHRAVLLSAIAQGQTSIYGLSNGDDVARTVAAIEALGVECRRDGEGLIVKGNGSQLSSPDNPIDLGNSGTGIRLLSGLLAGLGIDAVLKGDESLSRRPMTRIITPLERMGARIRSRDGLPPLEIVTQGALKGVEYDSPIASAQVKSAILLAGLHAEGRTRVREPLPSRDHTERMLPIFGIDVLHDDRWIAVEGGGVLDSPGEIRVAGDFSAAMFWLVAATIIEGSDLTIENVNVNPLRTGGLDILLAMGANVDKCNEREQGGEPVADLRVKSARLRGISIGPDQVPAAIDEFPILFVAAAFADGETAVRGAAELRAKESDRLAVMATALTQMGGQITEHADGITIVGSELRHASVSSGGDHRCAMSLAIAGAGGQGCRVDDIQNVGTSYPDFLQIGRRIGMQWSQSS